MPYNGEFWLLKLWQTSACVNGKLDAILLRQGVRYVNLKTCFNQTVVFVNHSTIAVELNTWRCESPVRSTFSDPVLISSMIVNVTSLGEVTVTIDSLVPNVQELCSSFTTVGVAWNVL